MLVWHYNKTAALCCKCIASGYNSSFVIPLGMYNIEYYFSLYSMMILLI